MSAKHPTKLRILAASVAVVIATGTASANDRLIRDLIGIGGAVILNEAQKNKRPPPRRRHQNYNEAAQKAAEARELRKEVQRRLNQLGFNAGYPDGVYGPKTRKAISGFQASIGAVATGKITVDQIDMLYAQTSGPGGAAGNTMASQDYPSGDGNAFPKLGGDSDGSASNGGSFPKLGVATGESGSATAAFPQIGAAKETSSGSANPFPEIGGGDSASATEKTFPTLGSGSRKPDENTKEFPLIANETARVESGFPALQAKTGSETEQHELPALGSPPEPTETSMPELSSAPAAAETGMPELHNTTSQNANLNLPDDFEQELSKTPYGSAGEQPEISGITLGSDVASIGGKLAESGFTACAESGARYSCERATDLLDETIQIWSRDGSVWAIQRKVKFKAPVPGDIIDRRLQETYATLMKNGRTIASSSGCNIGELGYDHLVNVFDSGKTTGAPDVTAYREGQLKSLSSLAIRCPLAYSVQILQMGEVTSEIHFVFFDGTVVNGDYKSVLAAEEAQHDNIREKVATDLKF